MVQGGARVRGSQLQVWVKQCKNSTEVYICFVPKLTRFLSDFDNPQQKFRSIRYINKRVNLRGVIIISRRKHSLLIFLVAPPWKAASTREQWTVRNNLMDRVNFNKSAWRTWNFCAQMTINCLPVCQFVQTRFIFLRSKKLAKVYLYIFSIMSLSYSFAVSPLSPNRQETICLLQNATQASNPAACVAFCSRQIVSWRFGLSGLTAKL